MKLDAMKTSVLRDCVETDCSQFSKQSAGYRLCARECIEKARESAPEASAQEPQPGSLPNVSAEYVPETAPEIPKTPDVETGLTDAEPRGREPVFCGEVDHTAFDDPEKAEKVIACFDEYLKTCSPAKLRNNIIGDSYIEIQNIQEGNCLIKTEFVVYLLYPPLSGKTMTCSIPAEDLTFEKYADFIDRQIFDLCQGDFIDGMNDFICSVLSCPGACEKGSCVDDTFAENPSCTDTDDGMQYYFYGETTGFLSDEKGAVSQVGDTCVDSYGSQTQVLEGPYLYEHYCGGDVVRHIWFQCPAGCVSGVCRVPVLQSSPQTTLTDESAQEGGSVPEDESAPSLPRCFDSDGGNDIYVRGVLDVYTPSHGNATVSEYCVDETGAREDPSDYVEELRCMRDPEYAYTHERQPCPNGCSDGACNP